MPELSQIEAQLIAKERELAEREKALAAERAELNNYKAALNKLKGFSGIDRENGQQVMFNIPAGGPMSIGEAVRFAINELKIRSGKISAPSVSKLLLELPHGRLNFDVLKGRSNISSILRDMAKEGLLVVKIQGQGRAPTIYAVTKDFQ